MLHNIELCPVCQKCHNLSVCLCVCVNFILCDRLCVFTQFKLRGFKKKINVFNKKP
jgi:hypothetical protein